MANLEELVVSLVAETSGLRAELSKATSAVKDSTKKMDDAISSFSENSSKNVSFFETSMATMVGFLGSQAVLAVAGAVKDAFVALGEELLKGGAAAIAEENALKRLANSLALSGQYTESAMISLQKFTGDMEALTGVSDEVVASNLAVLSSLTKLDSEGLKRAQSAALDMSAALGIDLDAATRLVAKGIEGNTDAFKRYGINIQEGANKTENMTNVLGKLEKSFGGAAAGAAQTFGGAFKNLKNSWGNFNEALATTITQNPVVIAMMNKITEIIMRLTNSAQGSAAMIQGVLGKAFIYLTEVLGTLSGMLDSVFGRFTDKFAKATDALAEVNYVGVQAMDQIGKGSVAATATIKNQAMAVEELNEKQKELLRTKLEDQEKSHQADFSFETEQRKLQLETELALLVEHGQNKWDVMNESLIAQQELMTSNHEIEMADLEAKNAAGLLKDSEYANQKKALLQKQALDEQKINLDKLKNEQAMQAATRQGYSTFLDGMSVLQQSSSKELVAIGKAAAITKATIDAYVAIQNALATVPFPANIAASAGIGVMAFANVAKIAGIGFNDGGTLVGGGANVDSVPATLTKGETVVTRDLTDKMNDFFSGGSSGGNQVITVELSLKDQLIEFIEAKIVERQRTNVSLIEAI